MFCGYLNLSRIRAVPMSSPKKEVPPSASLSPTQLPPLVRLELELLRMRRRAVGDEQGDPVWAMVLELCAARLEGREVSVTSLCLASGLPVTTALRRLDELERDGRITRSPDKNDRRRVFVALKSEFHDRLLEQLVAMARVRSEFSFTE